MYAGIYDREFGVCFEAKLAKIWLQVLDIS